LFDDWFVETPPHAIAIRLTGLASQKDIGEAQTERRRNRKRLQLLRSENLQRLDLILFFLRLWRRTSE
jgi:hypothetical protein